MSNPVITENLPGSNYSISESARVHVTFQLTMAFGEANFDFTFPGAPAAISLIRTAGGNIALTVPAAVEQSNNTIAGGARIVRWQTNAGGTTLHVRVEDTTFSAINEEWTIRVSGLPVVGNTTVTAGDNATIILVEADPIVEVLTPALIKKELELATLQARARRNTNPLPVGGCAGVTLTWSQAGGDPIMATPVMLAQVPTVFPDLTPGCQRDATVDLPAITASVILNYTFSAVIGEFSNSGTATITASTRVRHSMLVVDRSGSMGGAKWDNAVKAAHIWLDLLTAFRTGINAEDRVGVMVFEDGNCSFRAIGAPDPDVRIEFPVPGGAPAPYPVLPAPVSLTIGSPGDCTPIGDALIVALNKMIGLPTSPAPHNSAAFNFYSILLMTDGLENAGTVRVDKEPPPPLALGVEIFDNIRSINDGVNDRTIFKFTNPGRNTRFYAVGVGPDGGVSTDVLDDLSYGDVPNVSGYYRLVTNVQEMVSAFGEMLSHDINAARQVAFAAPPSGLADPGAPAAGTAAYFLVPSGEAKLVVILLWNALADELELRWRHQGVPDEQFVVVPGGALTPHKRGSHAVAIVDLTSSGINTTGTEWRVQYRPGGGAIGAISPNNVLAARDLRVRTEIVFDRTSYRTGQPMKIEARMGAGSDPITGAKIDVELARPGESLGTFLSVNSKRFQITTIPGTTTTASPTGSPVPVAGGGDPQRPKQALLSHLLKLRELEELPVLKPPSIFVDGTNQLHDDGTHGDGAANDGRYANTFANTDMEGTYTFRFTISGETPDGSRFVDTITMSRWVGVNVDPNNSLIEVDFNLPPLNDRFQVAQVFVTPIDRQGQFLGPFRTTELQFVSRRGSFQGEVQVHLDGRYSRKLVFPKGITPDITVKVQGKTIEYGRPGLTDDKHKRLGCLSRIPIIGTIIRWLFG